MYKDQSLYNFDLTLYAYEVLSKGLQDGKHGVILPEIGVLVLDDIRAVIKQKVKEETPVEGANPALSAEEMMWVEQYRRAVQEGGY
jgi:hypothetical protein